MSGANAEITARSLKTAWTRIRAACLTRTADTWDALKLANQQIGGRTGSSQKGGVLPPVVDILSPPENTVFARPELTLQYHVRSAAAPITGIQVLVDGRPTLYERQLPTSCPNNRECTANVTVIALQRDVTMSVVGFNINGASAPAKIHLKWSGPEIPSKPNLYVFAVGVSKFRDQLVIPNKYAAKDAADFAEAAKRQQGGIYENVTTRVLLDEAANLQAIREGLSWLKRNVTSKDVAMVFISGQSAQRYAADYDFLPFDVDLPHADLTSLHDFELKYFLSDIPGKVLLFIDGCYSGQGFSAQTRRDQIKSGTRADINNLANDLSQSGVVVFASSTSQQPSYESEAWQHGAFTMALLEGLSGQAALNRQDTGISINSLAMYVTRRVGLLTQGRQTPSVAKPPVIEDFAIAEVR